jgi:hypothetical protein
MIRSSISSSTRRHAVALALASACACAAVLLVPRQAQAYDGSFDLGIDGDATALLAPSPTQKNVSDWGGGFKVRFGDHFKLRNGLFLTPEVAYAFDHVFASNNASTNNGGVGYAENMNRILAGLRVGYGHTVIPTVYGHVGYGFRSVSNSGTVADNAGIVPGSNGFTADLGIAVEFRIARHLFIGPHAEWVWIDTANNQPQWLAVGGHVDFVF